MMDGVTYQRSTSSIPILQRKTGVLVNENIPTYISSSLKLMFGTRLSRKLPSGSIGVKLMTKLSKAQGEKFNKPESTAEIPAFVQLHNLDLNEVSLRFPFPSDSSLLQAGEARATALFASHFSLASLCPCPCPFPLQVEKPLAQYATFNEFFARGLKPSARPIDAPQDNTVAVSAADCRLTVFPSILSATELWIKGDRFTVDSVIGPKGADQAAKFANGALAIFRLAPQDYHRW